MEKQIKEPDIIGGQGPLTKEEESAISKHLADKKAKGKRKVMVNPTTRKKEKFDYWGYTSQHRFGCNLDYSFFSHANDANLNPIAS
jgi:hypothetical protein